MLWADAPAAPSAWPIVEVSLWLAGFLLAGAIAVQLVKWQRQRSRGRISTLSDQLAEFRQAFERGEMSKEEYERVHSLLTGRLRESAAPPPAAAEASPLASDVPPTPSASPSSNGEQHQGPSPMG